MSSSVPLPDVVGLCPLSTSILDIGEHLEKNELARYEESPLRRRGQGYN